MITKDEMKKVFIALLIGAGTAFFSTLFAGLADFFKANSTEMISGGVASFTYLTRNIRA